MNIFSFMVPKTMTKFLESDATIRQALEKMDFYKFSVVPLLDKYGRYLGTISEGDLLSFIKNDCSFDLKKGEDIQVMNITRYRSYQSLNVNGTFEEMVALSMEQNFIPLVDDRDTFIGIVPRKRILEHLLDSYHGKVTE